jgi:acetyltransferase-like isoleucine patch superfamily enzyme
MPALHGGSAHLRALAIRATHRVHNLWPQRLTGLRAVYEQVPPPPQAFARFGESSWIAPPTEIHGAHRIVVDRDVTIMEGARIFVWDDDATTGGLLEIGSGVRLARFNTIHCGVGVRIGNDVASSDWVTIVDTWRHPGARPFPAPKALDAPVVIGDRAYLGAGCTILPGVTIGEGAFIGEGAGVTDDVPPHTKVYGYPATVVRRWNGTSWEGPEWP